MLPLLGVALHPTFKNIGDISGNYERILIKFSGICLLARVISRRYKSVNMLPLLVAAPHPPPHFNIGDIYAP